MKKIAQLFSVLLLLACCSCRERKITVDNAFADAREYIASKFDKKKILDNESFVMFTTPDSTSYILKKANIIIGDLNKDNLPDVIISYIVVSKDKSFSTKHVIFLNNKGDLIPKKEFQMEIFIKKIADGIIFAEKSRIASDSPNYGCLACMEKISYRFEKDSLIQITK